MFYRAACCSIPVLLLACNQSGVADVTSETEDDGVTETTDQPDGPLATGIDITKVSINQGVDVVLMDGGEAVTKVQSPIIKDRDALLRVFVTPHDDWNEREIEAVVTVGGEVLSDTKNVTTASTQEKLNSTLNVDIPGELLDQDVTIEVALRELSGNARRESPGIATWTSDEIGGVVVENTDQLDIVIIPVAYHWDGSGRLPDTSEEQLELIYDRVYGMYPASEVTVTVGQTLDWYGYIDAFSGWDSLLVEINDLRARANVPPNTYYYGMFRPTENFNAFCQSGCILGLSFLGFSANDPWYRASIGIGYTGDISADTAPHEIGHAHGREHAPCGLYGQPADPGYPHSNANLGTWGYDLVAGELISPTDGKDLMSYCSPMWVSDYTWYNLYKRIQEVGRQNRSATSTWRVMRITPEGDIVPGSSVELATPSGEPMDVELLDGIGRSLGTTTGLFVPYSHLDGGVVLVPDTPDLHTIAL